MKAITPIEALEGRAYAIVKSEPKEGEMRIYGLYPDESTARRIAKDLCVFYGGGAYYAAHIEGL